jgi:hypothetical protein
VSIDLHAFPLLAFFGFNLPIDSSTGYSKIPRLGPGSGIATDNTDGSLQRIDPADLERLFNAGVISWVHILALVKGWPMYLFDRTQQPPSGIALSIMENGLVNQVERKQRAFSGAWRAAFNLARKLHRLKTGQELTGQIKFTWQPAQVKDRGLELDHLKAEFEAGQYPIPTRWRLLGKSEEDIAQMFADKQREDDFGLADVVTGVTQ